MLLNKSRNLVCRPLTLINTINTWFKKILLNTNINIFHKNDFVNVSNYWFSLNHCYVQFSFLLNLWAQMIIWQNLSLHLAEYGNSNLNLCLLSHMSVFSSGKMSPSGLKWKSELYWPSFLIINIEWTVYCLPENTTQHCIFNHITSITN